MHNHGLARGWFVIDEDKKMMVEEQQPDIPVTILTGFLGAGKTTLLNRILSENHNYKIAIVENEFGKENIDTDLLVQTDREQIVNMNNGCVCCTIRGDLSKVLTDLRLRRSRARSSSTTSSSRPAALPILVPSPRPSSWTMPSPPSSVLTAW